MVQYCMVFTVSSMVCIECSRGLRKKLLKVAGVDNVEINFLTGCTQVFFSKTLITESQIVRVITRAGYSVSTIGRDPKLELLLLKKKVFLCLLFMVPLLYIGMGAMIKLPILRIINLNVFPLNNIVLQIILLLPILWITRNIILRGLKALMNLTPTMESLITLGVLGSLIYSISSSIQIFFSKDMKMHPQIYFESAGMLLTVILLGQMFEAHGKSRARKSLNSLLNLASNKATLLNKDGSHKEVDIKSINVGDCIMIRPGEQIPLDGQVIFGYSDVDESRMTGESMPVTKKEGDKVIGTTINHQGLLHIKVLNIGKDTIFEQIVRMVEKVQGEKTPLIRITDSISRWFVPCIIAVAIISGLAWFLQGSDLSFALNIMIATLVVACPCALALAIPLTIVMSVSSAAQNGILFKSGAALQTLIRVKKIIFDKTGTLTHGKMQVVAHYIRLQENEVYYLSLMRSLEDLSLHPLAKTLCTYLSDHQVYKVNNLENLTGEGVQANIDNHHIILGNRTLMMKKNCHIPDHFVSLIRQAEEQLHLIVYGAIDGSVEVIFLMNDVIKEECRPVLQYLKEMGIESIILSGDVQNRVDKIVKDLELTEGYGALLPHQKAEIIAKEQKKGYFIAMVGDGVNDAVALTRADVGIAVAQWSNIAMESADIILMKDDLKLVMKAILLSKRTVRIIKQNLFWALNYNIIALPLTTGIIYTFGGPLLTPVWAAIFMVSSSLFVVFNALRVRIKLS